MPAPTRTISVVLQANDVMNSNRRTDAHPYIRPKKTRLIRELFANAGHNIPPIATPIEVTLQLHFGRKHRRDSPNWYPTAKAAIDGLVQAGVIEDDSDHNIHWTHIAAHTIDPALKADKAVGLDARVRLTITLTTTTPETPK